MTKLDDILDAHSKRESAETSNDIATTTVNFPGENKSVVYSKDCWVVGTFANLREIGDKFSLSRPRDGFVCRIISFDGESAILDPMEGDVLTIPVSTKIWYEPWSMDRGSYLFEHKDYQGMLKLSTEGDLLSVLEG